MNTPVLYLPLEFFPVLENTQQKPHYETHGFFHISGNFGAYPKIIKYFMKIKNKIKCTEGERYNYKGQNFLVVSNGSLRSSG